MSEQRAVLYSQYSLPLAARCDLQLAVPRLREGESPKSIGFSGVLESSIFSGSEVRLTFRVADMPSEVRRLIGEYGMGPELSQKSAYRTV
jgi:hypothetical protein